MSAASANFGNATAALKSEPKSKLTVSMLPATVIASTPSFCKSLRLVERCVPAEADWTSKVIWSCKSKLRLWKSTWPEPKSIDRPRPDSPSWDSMALRLPVPLSNWSSWSSDCKATLMLSTPAAPKAWMLDSGLVPKLASNWSNWTFNVTFNAASSCSETTPSLFMSPKSGKALKSTPLPRSRLMLLTVAELPSKSPTALTASMPSFCRSLRLVERWVPAVLAASAVMSSVT